MQNQPNRGSLSSILLSPSHGSQCTACLVTTKFNTSALLKLSIALLLDLGECPAVTLVPLSTEQLLYELVDCDGRRNLERLAREVLGARSFPDLLLGNDVQAGAVLWVDVFHARQRRCGKRDGLDLEGFLGGGSFVGGGL